MRKLTVLLAALLALGACTSTRPGVEEPAPTPAERPAEEPQVEREEPTEPAEPEAELLVAPDDWWLLDAERDGIHATSVERAYNELLAGREPQRTVVVAIIDSGVDVEHEDLQGNIWVNEGERAGTGRDDDGNGYPDDLHGWNFLGGPDGRNVEQDTYEVTRLFAECEARAEGASQGAFATLDLDCDAIEQDFDAEVEEAREMLDRARQLGFAANQVETLLREHLGVEELSVEEVAKISTPQMDVIQAQQIYLQLAEHDITAELIEEEIERLEKRLEYGLDPAFDPRPIVDDDFADVRERHYGNADVEGPDAMHGTHVAGIVAAVRGNELGIEGIAPSARIMAIRAVPDGDERDKDVANAIRYAVDNGADVINMSFGKGYSPREDAVDDAVRYADRRGVLMVHAAGNDAADIDVEPNFPTRFLADGDSALHWIEVGASAWQGIDQLAAPFTNYGRRHVHVFAPGVSIRSTVPGSEYQASSGTSMAAPVVSGLAALIMAYYPELEPLEVKQILLDSAVRYEDQRVVRPGTEDEEVRFGDLSATGAIVNAYQALTLAEERAAAHR